LHKKKGGFKLMTSASLSVVINNWTILQRQFLHIQFSFITIDQLKKRKEKKKESSLDVKIAFVVVPALVLVNAGRSTLRQNDGGDFILESILISVLRHLQI
jgi:Na+/H+ antiporter NhaA